jgi:hypothetical protein
MLHVHSGTQIISTLLRQVFPKILKMRNTFTFQNSDDTKSKIFSQCRKDPEQL